MPPTKFDPLTLPLKNEFEIDDNSPTDEQVPTKPPIALLIAPFARYPFTSAITKESLIDIF